MRAIRLFAGRWKYEILSGTIDSIGKVIDRPPRHFAKNVNFVLDGGRKLTARVIKLGPELREAGVLRSKGRGLWLISGRRRGDVYPVMMLLGANEEGNIVVSRHDLACLHEFTYVNALFAAIIIFALTFMFLVLSLPAPHIGDDIANNVYLVIGLSFVLPFICLLILGRASSKKMESIIIEELSKFAANNPPSLSPVPESKAQPGPPPLFKPDNGLEVATGIVSVAAGPWYFLIYLTATALSWIYSIITAVLTFPEFEARRLKIISHKKVIKNFCGELIFSQAIVKDLTSGVIIKVKKLTAADNLIINGLITPETEGQWLVVAKRLKQGQIIKKMSSLKLAAFFDGERIHYDKAGVLKLFGYRPGSPVLAAICGAAVSLLALYPKLSQVTFTAVVNCTLIIGLCVLIPYLLTWSAGARIQKSVDESLKRVWPTYYSSMKSGS